MQFNNGTFYNNLKTIPLNVKKKNISINNHFQKAVAIIGLRINRYGDKIIGEQNIIPNVTMTEVIQVKLLKWPRTI